MHAIFEQDGQGLVWVENCPDEDVKSAMTARIAERSDDTQAIFALPISAFVQLDLGGEPELQMFASELEVVGNKSQFG